jgi:hypothetical protein
MSNIFQPLTYAKRIPTVRRIPVQAVDNLGNTLETRYRENLDKIDLLDQVANSLDVRDINRPGVDQALVDAKDVLTPFAEKGNYENASLAVREATKTFANNKLVQGAVKDKKAYDSWMAQVDGMYEEGKIDFETYKNTKAMVGEDNTSPLTYDPESGVFDSMFKGYTPAEYQDITQAMLDMASTWKSDEDPIPIKYNKNGKTIESKIIYDPAKEGYFFTGTSERVTAQELQSALTTAVMSDPKYMSYINQNLMFHKRKLKKANASVGINGIRPENIASDNPIDSPLFAESREKFEAELEKAGLDPQKVFNDPQMLEALYDNYYRKKVVNDYITPAVESQSFKKDKYTLHDDKVFMESLKQRNRLVLEAQKHKNAKALKDYEQEFKIPVFLQNPGVLIPGESYDANKLGESITENKKRLASLDRQLNDPENRGSYNRLKKERDAVAKEIAVQEASYVNHAANFLESEEGEALLNEIMEGGAPPVKDLKAGPAGIGVMPNKAMLQTWWASLKVALGHGIEGKPRHPDGSAMSKNEVKQLLLEPSNIVEGDYDNRPILGGAFKGQNVNKQLILEAKKGFRNDVNKYVKSSADPSSANYNSLYTNVLTAEDVGGAKKPYLSRMNESLTTRVIENGTDYLVEGGVQLDGYINDLLGSRKIDTDKVDIAVAMTGDDVNGEFPHYMTIKDKKTGKFISQVHIYPKSGGAEEAYWTGIGLMREAPPTSEAYRTGNYMAANASYPEMAQHVIEPQLTIVDDLDPEGTKAYTKPFTAGNNMFVIEKARKTFVSPTNGKSGTNTVYRLIQVDPSRVEEVEDMIQKPGTTALQDLQNSGLAKAFLPNERFDPEKLANPLDATYFANLRDLKVSLYNASNQ